MIHGFPTVAGTDRCLICGYQVDGPGHECRPTDPPVEMRGVLAFLAGQDPR